MGTSCTHLDLGGSKTRPCITYCFTTIHSTSSNLLVGSSSMFVPLFLNNKSTFECGFIFMFRNFFLNRTEISFSSWLVLLSFFFFFLIDHGSYSYKNETWFYLDQNIISRVINCNGCFLWRRITRKSRMSGSVFGAGKKVVLGKRWMHTMNIYNSIA